MNNIEKMQRIVARNDQREKNNDPRKKIQKLADILNEVGEKYHPNIKWKAADVNGKPSLLPVGNQDEETSRRIKEAMTMAGIYPSLGEASHLNIGKVGRIYREYFDGTYEKFENLASILNVAGVNYHPDHKWKVSDGELELVDKNGKGVDTKTAHKIGNALANAGVTNMDVSVAQILNLEISNHNHCVKGLRLHINGDVLKIQRQWIIPVNGNYEPLPSLAEMSRLGQGYSKKLQEEYTSIPTKVTNKVMNSSIVNKLKNVRF